MRVCAKCGKPHWRNGRTTCTAHHRRNNTEPCLMFPALGAPVCRRHGGGAPRVKAAAEARAAEHRIIAKAAVLGVPIDIDPAQALLQEVQRSAGHVAWYLAQIQELDPAALVHGTRYVRTVERTGFNEGEETEHEIGPAVHVLLDLYNRERTHLAKVAALALQAGANERLVKWHEETATRLVDGLQWLIAQAGTRLALAADQRGLLHEIAGEMLGRLRPGEAA